MGVAWTKEQEQVIALRERNILVSAAAGSGKTAVLVERIIQKITDEHNPVDIDRLVIVTFTKAAAGEMKERIRRAIEKQAALLPDNSHLQRQKTLIHNANITTIHSFCKNIIQNHFQEIELDPNFRIADEGELKLLKRESIKQVLEEYYEEGSEAFHQFVETYATGKSDDGIEELVLELHNFAMSYPWPKKWLENCIGLYGIKNVGEIRDADWMKEFMQYLKKTAEYLQERILYAKELVNVSSGPYMHAEVIQYYAEIIQKLLQHLDYEAWYDILRYLEHPALSRKRDPNVEKELRDMVKGIRDEVKVELESLIQHYFYQSPAEMAADMQHCQQPVTMLIKLTCSFMEAFQEKKRNKNILDYQDLEHDALSILVDKDGNPTKTAIEYGEYFEEILIDEYQDSNMVQELLLTSVSKEASGKNNIFMVGDSKQSIYRFRLARPELFLMKFETYTTEESECQRIDLHKNFRSRKEVLDGANYIFSKIMQKSLGGIQYDGQAALYVGADYLDPLNQWDYATELLLFESKLQDIEEEIEVDGKECEAKIIAHRIKKLLHDKEGLSIVDKQTGQYRKAQYRDIVILLRSPKDYAEPMLHILANEGIPAHIVSGEGYFNATEIVTMLNLLRIIDNPIQDIPLASVLRSPIGGMTDEELAKVKAAYKKARLYDAVKQYMADGADFSLQKKLCGFFQMLDTFREKVIYMSLHEYIWMLLDETGYGDSICVMPAGEQRKANMDMLVEKAIAFEQTSYLGLFHFVQYIEQLQKYEIDFGEANILNEKDNTVRIMTIHKSKGLEFPIVFVAGLGKGFNQMESRRAMIAHPDIGIGVDQIRLDTRQKSTTLIKRVIQKQSVLEGLGEELRVLYVALTRAKEKLILVGGRSNLSKDLAAYAGYPVRNEVSFGELCKSKCYLNWIMSALIQHKSFRPILENLDICPPYEYQADSYAEAEFLIRYVDLQVLLEDEFADELEERKGKIQFEDELSEYEKPLPENLMKALEYRYPFEDEAGVAAKLSVSEIKQGDGLSEEEELMKQIYEVPEVIPLYPNFVKTEEEKTSPTAMGNAYHKVFECLDWKRVDTIEEVEQQVRELANKEILSEELTVILDSKKIYAFTKSGIGQRMKKASENNRLHREQPFVLGVPAKETDTCTDSDQIVMVQGMMDAYFEEEGGLVLVDYKTDSIVKGEEQQLVERYRIQLEYYEKALSQITDRNVKEKIIYSLALQKEIAV